MDREGLVLGRASGPGRCGSWSRDCASGPAFSTGEDAVTRTLHWIASWRGDVVMAAVWGAWSFYSAERGAGLLAAIFGFLAGLFAMQAVYSRSLRGET